MAIEAQNITAQAEVWRGARRLARKWARANGRSEKRCLSPWVAHLVSRELDAELEQRARKGGAA